MGTLWILGSSFKKEKMGMLYSFLDRSTIQNLYLMNAYLQNVFMMRHQTYCISLIFVPDNYGYSLTHDVLPMNLH